MTDMTQGERDEFLLDRRYRTADGNPILPGSVLFNYYDYEPVLVPIPTDSMEHLSHPNNRAWDGWFKTVRLGRMFDSGPLLNGERMCVLTNQTHAQRWCIKQTPDELNDLIQMSLRHGRAVAETLLKAMTPAKVRVLMDLNHAPFEEDMMKSSMIKRLLDELC